MLFTTEDGYQQVTYYCGRMNCSSICSFVLEKTQGIVVLSLQSTEIAIKPADNKKSPWNSFAFASSCNSTSTRKGLISNNFSLCLLAI